MSFTASRTLSRLFKSNANSGECTPITTRPRSLVLRRPKRERREIGGGSQLMHEYVQKSTSTTFPVRVSGVKRGELSQSFALARAANSRGAAFVSAGVAEGPRSSSPPSRESAGDHHRLSRPRRSPLRFYHV